MSGELLNPDVQANILMTLQDLANGIQATSIKVCEQATRPSVLLKPALEMDGSMWCARYGDPGPHVLQGFGDTPDAAMSAFDEAYYNEPTSGAILSGKHVIDAIEKSNDVIEKMLEGGNDAD